ncbi:HAD family hydrolase [Rhodovulum sp. DZ06]|uniref:HAD family hydrolase n=1 Tax=Rhodovulum sp. DZ06 TaxID=3425126 RepID=UPI003D342A91
MTLRAIIFNVNGTLADTEPLHLRAFNRAFRDAGFDWVWDDATYARLLSVEGGLPRIRAWVEEHHPRDLAALENAGTLEALHAAKSDLYLRKLEANGVPMRPGVMRLIRDAASEGVKLGVVTTSSRENFEALILNSMGFEALDWFGAVITGDDVSALKPDPEGYVKACAALGVDPADAVAIEDGPRGVTAAAAAGMRVIACPGRASPMAPVPGAAMTLTDLGEPGAPFDVIAGDPGHWSYVSCESLRAWFTDEAAAA